MTKQNHDAAAIVELRRYRLKPGARETLIALFDGELVAPQEEAGMTVLGQFRDIDDPDCFVWLRGFADMQKRAEALGRFYGGPIWAAHAQAANDTMVNSDNVLLLRPQTPEAEAALSSTQRPPKEMDEAPAGLIVCTICHLAPAPGRHAPTSSRTGSGRCSNGHRRRCWRRSSAKPAPTRSPAFQSAKVKRCSSGCRAFATSAIMRSMPAGWRTWRNG